VVDTLDKYIQRHKEKADEYLKYKGFKYSKAKELYYTKVNFNDKEIDLRLVLPPNFPIKYPKIYLDDKDLYLKYPHIEKYKNQLGSSLCYIDNFSKDYSYNAKDTIDQTLKATDEYLSTHKSDGDYSSDFFDEFSSYWGDSILHIYPFELSKSIQPIDIIDTTIGKIVTNDIDRVKEYLQPKEHIQKAIYMHFDKHDSIISFDFFGILEAIKTSNLLEQYNEYIKKGIYNIAIFSFSLDSNLIYAGYKIENCPKQLNYKLHKYSVKRLDKEYLFTRGSSDMIKSVATQKHSVAIVGCGSLGGSLAFKLAKNGIQHIKLIDNDLLKNDNIARHICGVNDIGKYKVNALKEFIQKNVPECEIESFVNRGEDIIDQLESSDLVVIAVGHEGRELYNLYSQISSNAKVLTWFEYDYGGHYIFYNSRKESSQIEKIFNNIGLLKPNLDDLLIKKDINCGAFYAPYSAIDAEFTINHVAKFVFKYFIDKDIEEHSLSILLKYDNKIKDEYKEYTQYNTIIRDKHGNIKY
jgi:NADH/NAD ratio-sensing transcriptional regulator Rex